MSQNPMEMFLERYPPTPEVIRDTDLEETTYSSVQQSPRRLPVERTLDLHGYTLEEAGLQLDRFVLASQAEAVSKVLIIHGKGNHGESTGVMKQFVRNYLEKNPHVGATGVPSVRDGGAGATWAMIRQRSR